PRGRGRGGRGGYRANVVGTEGELIRTEASLVNNEESRQWKEKIQISEDKDQDDYVGDFVNFAYINEGKANREESWECDQA
ncbi:unnamed protein product, partial [Urochloa humidicola]